MDQGITILVKVTKQKYLNRNNSSERISKQIGSLKENLGKYLERQSLFKKYLCLAFICLDIQG